MSDSYSWWRQALLGHFGPIHENDPQPGYYRMRKGRGGRWVPAAIWEEKDNLGLSCLVDGVERDPFEVWTWVCRYPITYETYVAVAERGEAWPEDLPDLNKARSVSNSDPFQVSPSLEQVAARVDEYTSLVSASSSAAATHSTASSPNPSSSIPTLGHNSVGVSEAEGFMEEIELLWQSANEWLEVVQSPSSQAEADKAANYAERFGNLENRAEEARTAEKKPVLDLGRAIDAKWKPVISKASDGKVRMKKALGPYFLAERERRLSNSSGKEIEPPRAGTSGRRIGLRARQVISVADEIAVEAHYRNDPRIWSEKSVKDLVHKLAEIDLLAGINIPGATLIEELTAT
ncbi:MAG: hypothetical protein ACKOB3_02635 [Holophagaceae bacterium]